MTSCSNRRTIDPQALAILPRGRYRYVRRRWHMIFGLIDMLGYSLGGAVYLVRWLARAGRPLPERPVERILIVQLDHLGDAVISSTMLPALRATYPQASIEVLASRRSRELFDACPDVERVHECRFDRFDRPAFGLWMLALVGWGLALRKRRYSLAIDPRGEFPHALLLWLCGASRRLGWGCGGGGFLLTDVPPYVAGRSEYESRAALLAQVGIEGLTVAPAAIDPGSFASKRIAREIEAVRGTAQQMVVLHIGAGTPAKAWPVTHWRELIGRLLLTYDVRIILVGGAAERRLAREITEANAWPGVVDWTDCLSLRELAALLMQADLVVGADSGPAHLAAALKRPVVVLFSGTNDVQQWSPVGAQVAVLRRDVECSPCHNRTCPLAEHACMNQLLPEAVLRELARFCHDPVHDTESQWLDRAMLASPLSASRLPVVIHPSNSSPEPSA